MWKLLTSMASPGGPSGSLTILFFHRVYPAVDPMAPGQPTVEGFDARMGWLQSQFNILPLARAVQLLKEGRLPPAAAAVTFDDGYRDNLLYAAPILRRRGIPATFFVATGFLDGGIMFNDVVTECMRRCTLPQLEVKGIDLPPLQLGSWQDRRQAVGFLLKSLKYLPPQERNYRIESLPAMCGVDLPKDLMLSTQELRDLATAGEFDVGAHTHNHPILSSVPDDEARAEIERGRDTLQRITKRTVNLFAYPNGRWQRDFDERHCKMVESAGFEAGFSTEPAAATCDSTPWAIPRFTPWDRNGWRYRMRLLRLASTRAKHRSLNPAAGKRPG